MPPFAKSLASSTLKINIWKAQGVPQYNKVAYPKHQEEEATPPNKNHIITSKFSIFRFENEILLSES